MMTKIVMPSMGATGDDVVVAEWLVKEGDRVKEGQQIFVAETDKATTEVEAFRGGYIRSILVKAGESAAIGDALAIIADSMDEPLEEAAVKRRPPAVPSSGNRPPPPPSSTAGRPYSKLPPWPVDWPRSAGSIWRPSKADGPIHKGDVLSRDPGSHGRRAADARFRPCAEPLPCGRFRARPRRPISTLPPASI